jgi:hypothetical protein
MATTTEPPYVHKNSGVAARNGTTTHVVNFTTDGVSPFTPAAGNFLVVVAFAGVTNTASGWAEPHSPVSSGELSVFTKTVVADTGITVTHNAANYPMNWLVYELPAGSSYDAGQQDTTSADTPPSLTGLPGGAGNERLVITARGRIAGSASETGASTVWGGSMVEDLDLFTVFATTDGCYLTVAHQINLTATSITPTGTPTYVGTWGVGDREKVTLSLIAAPVSSTTPFTKDVTESYRVYNAFTKDVQERYRITNAFTKDQAEVYRVFNALTKDVVERYRVYAVFTKDVVEAYRVYGAFTKDVVERYSVYNPFTKDVAEAYRVLNGWTKNTAESYRVLNALLKDQADSWRVFNTFTKNITETYTVLNGTGFIKDVVESWRVYNAFTKDMDERYRVLAPLLVDKVERYRVLNALVVDKADSWRVYAAFTRDVVERYRILSGIPTPPLSADVTAYLTAYATANLTAETVTAYL